MEILEFDADQPFHFSITGKFAAEDDNWIHMTRELLDYELVMVTDGDFYIGNKGEESVIHTGEFMLIKPTNLQHGTRHSLCSFYWLHFSYKNGTKQPVSYDTELLPDGRLPAIPADKRLLRIPVSGVVPKPDRMSVLFKQLQDCSLTYNDRVLNDFYTTVILSELAAQLRQSAESIRSDHGTQLYYDIIAYIDWHIKENLRVEQVAEHFGYNSKYITTLFRKYANISIKQYILNRKIEIAKALLSETNRAVADIGYEVGFADNHNFSNTFKRIVGQTPSTYRETYAKRILLHV